MNKQKFRQCLHATEIIDSASILVPEVQISILTTKDFSC